MYVSGTLKNKTINFYKEKMTSFDTSGIYTSDNSLTYEGELTFVPWASEIEKKLINKQNIYISKLKENISNVLYIKFSNKRCGTQYFYYDSIVKKILKKIDETNPKLIFALLECLYALIKNTDNDNLNEKLNEFQNLIDYLNNNAEILNQTDIDIICTRFLNNQGYDLDSLLKYKIRTFRINEKELTDSTVYELYRLGEFIAPTRLATISKELLYEELSRVIAPIYFAIKDERLAKQFLNSCKQSNLTSEQIIKNATRMRIPSNLINRI